jgi:hypothetical protein
MVIRLSAKGFAEFVLAGASKKAQIVRNIKKPKSTEAKIIVQYYAPAISIIRIFHSRDNDRTYLKKEISSLEFKLEKATSAQARAKLKNNLRALKNYIDVYGQRKREVVARPRIYFAHGDVHLSASPDLAVKEDGRLKLVKLGMTKKADNPQLVRIMLRVMYQAATGRFQIEPKDVVYFDVANAARIRGTTSDSDLELVIDNACDELARMA